MNFNELEDQIERWVERQCDRLDARFFNDDMSQEEYETQYSLITRQAEEMYKNKTSPYKHLQ